MRWWFREGEESTRVFVANSTPGSKPSLGRGRNYVSTTKYNFVTFLPKALYEQFRRIANVYFTIVAALSCTEYSPVHPITTFSPLLMVLGISIAKEALEDFKRLKADTEVNNRKVDIFDTDKRTFLPKCWKDVRVGDIVVVKKDHYFPADLLFLSVDNNDGVCFIETINLDGESNLKIKKAVPETASLTADGVDTFDARVECEVPNASLYTFVGNMYFGSATIPLSSTSLLLRGCSLRNTPSIMGLVVYTGHESKVMMNATDPPSKRTRIERSMDKVILFMFALLFTMCLWGAIYFATWTREISPKAWYLLPDEPSDEFDPGKPLLVAVSSFVTSFIIYGYLIPISLYVSIETVKVIQAMMFIARDKSMYHAESNTPAVARTSNLNEELGMVHTILSDKTGTLTRNVMEFFKCSIGGVVYGEGVTEVEKTNATRLGYILEVETNGERERIKEPYFNFYDRRLLKGKWVTERNPSTIRHFFRLLAVCHTVIPDGERVEDKISYEAESPDEQALVVAAKKFGFFFYYRGATFVRVRERVGNTVEDAEYEILNILEFSSTRKRMSVVFRGKDGRIFLYCKGADTVIYERLDPTHKENARMKEATRRHMEEFGGAGLRTLCLSYVELDSVAYDKWQTAYVDAKTSVIDRDKKVEDVAELLERNLRLLGCTAIEDQLQEGVPRCIENLAKAGIRIWVLTGDKQETAINIGFACSLLDDDMVQYVVSVDIPAILELEAQGKTKEAESLARQKVREQLQDILTLLKAEKKDSLGENALIIDGKALTFALAKPVRRTFMSVGTRCKSVICCRVSPKQKAEVTSLVKKKGEVTLAIGDGANDVGMIQEADIGVGISGQEGMQAVMSSDFAIAQFRFLEPLLLVHGRWCYKRITRMVAFFLYKNVFFGLTIFLYNALTLFSGQLIYDDFYMSLYNVIFTSLAPLAVGLLDQDVDRQTSLRFPELYRQGQRNAYFNIWVRIVWFLYGFLHAAITMCVVFMSTALYADRKSGETYGHWQVGTILFSCVVVTVHVQLASILEHWTVLHHVAIWGSIGIWFVYLLVYGALPVAWSSHMHLLFMKVSGTTIQFYLIIALTVMVCIIPDILIRNARRLLLPEDHHIIQELTKLEKKNGLKVCDKKKKTRRTVSLEEVPSLVQLGRRTSMNRGYVPGDAPGSLSYFTPKSTLDQIEHEARGVSRHPVVAKLERELSSNPYRHRSQSQGNLEGVDVPDGEGLPGDLRIAGSSGSEGQHSGSSSHFNSV
ncbi:hypothetical protein BSKO_03730 [Bryopsis sp. KO-2023]|nr:hypothetical protein BSKO_03730 [Bryopsis sp. KO-2023]